MSLMEERAVKDNLDEKETDDVVDEAEIEDEEVEEDEDSAALAADDDDEEDGQASLEELIAQRAAGRKAAEETEDEGDIMTLASEPDEPVVETLPTKVAPIRDQKEFVCKSCYLVKPRVQMADPKREYCRDCV